MITSMTGCQSAPEVLEFKQEYIDIKSERAIPMCEWPEVNESVLDGQNIIYMTDEEFKKQRSCQVTEQANYETAENNADSVDLAIKAFNSLVDKAKLHNEYAKNELTRVNDEKNSKSLELMGYKGVLALVLIAVSL